MPSNLQRAFLDGDWDVFAGQYFDRFDVARHVMRAEEIEWKPWWPRWISIDWGFEHPAAVYWHAQGEWKGEASIDIAGGTEIADSATPADRAGVHRGVVTYREYVTHRTPPRELAREIVARCFSGGESAGKAGATWDDEKRCWKESSESREKSDCDLSFARRVCAANG